uniref:NAD(P)-dependent dehydrogenase, short-chain alcohol dehydrogenase family n=1 Tax=Candidatus Kentrum sp. FM TaxID=2126340 RepID=A0A450TS20_9GAMM|nr:MAG: NAD(P)-dependent dehydrogenase, short-chain alcohol dehydrogenase family [Candidatus Kentron sp. FM]VFJ71790.1 MAG: NAD(P)-dependent dehydrogenase, short-chain alcohol dehydrogenase family [Candidatus Kentron sp. FM]VFK19161.1 MAG: NAD(P)-dependent dehydrogenase, short-chain alcohol dehydrogenase family [Candidatus Kentron sp. FM]
MIETHSNRLVIPKPYAPAKDLLAARVILVTGAGTDLGGTAVRAFASHGATIVLLDHDVSALEAVYDDIVRTSAPKPAIYPMNLMGATPTDYEELASRIKNEFGHLDGLLHAGVELGVPSPIEHYDVVQWAKVIQVNLHAPFLLTRACLPLLQRAERASVVFTSADVGRRGRAYWGAYGVSCFAIEGLIQILADEVGTGSRLRVNGIDPGAVRTRLRAAAYPAEDPMTLPHPEEIMPAYLFLMGKDSHSLNGVVVTSY